MRKKLQQVFVYLLVVLFCIGRAEWSRAQVQNASLTGLVTDPTGAAVRGAMVTVRNSETNVAYSGESDAAGYYLFPSLSIGTYSVSVEVPGFKKAIHNDVVLEVGQRGRTDFSLEVGGLAEVVEVHASPSVLDTEQASPNTVLPNRMILDIPLSLRNWDDLLQTVPGVAGDRYTEQGGSTAAGEPVE